jgi:hypothetical protein
MAATPAPVSKSTKPIARKPSAGGSYGSMSPIGPGNRPPTIGSMPGKQNPAPVTGSGQTWSNPFIPAPRDGNRLPGKNPRNGGPIGPRNPRTPGLQLPGFRKGSGGMGSLQEIARRRLQGGI